MEGRLLYMNAEQMRNAAKALAPELVACRRHLHTIPGTGFDLGETLDYVGGELTKLGIDHKPCGKAGIVALVGGKKPGKVFLLRADMDALPIREESGESFSSENGKMHACGHDMHTTMLLGAAKLLKEREDEICGTVKLMFQPAEEIFCGADDMIAAGVLEDPHVDAAIMIHVMGGLPMPAGMTMICDGGVSASAADVFTIKVQGKGCHGSMPNAGIDPLIAAAHMLVTLQEIHARELAMSEEVALTFGSFHAGNAANVIPDTAELSGTMRTFDEEVRAHVKQRMEEIVDGVAKALRVEATVTYTSGCPTLDNNGKLSKCVAAYAKELLGPQMALTSGQLMAMAGGGGVAKAAGSEDFAFISQKVPSVMLGMAAGSPQTGYVYNQHHPKVRFDESTLPLGAAVYAYTALRWLEEHPEA